MLYPYAEARLLHVYGEMHARKGEPEPARERLEAALAIFRRLGARKDVERVEQVLSALRNAPPREASVQAPPTMPTRQVGVQRKRRPRSEGHGRRRTART
jgi:hypothetical protein